MRLLISKLLPFASFSLLFLSTPIHLSIVYGGRHSRVSSAGGDRGTRALAALHNAGIDLVMATQAAAFSWVCEEPRPPRRRCCC